ncbi:SRPBCC family protein [Pseudoteredinibacter isoporae]|uniref:Uncharacterized protein YndB with AHSA1/START domain n=1 Tax=Pseudoteredinibacter isoporae TaxID=570281 RepID=A0A7X0JR44_9GAMM|nr:SRPBCC domain-containing protein [Pseudoteredinibacter isoporae]MBB6519820.1 uncharacterized protein YndB with AHSA1/START domain [Pseudoteredinibacter isoporae]NHO85400.1 SRPBCC domain-containing protein [Pseudoteredinibacter isoporae]NIB26148.1 SRPBCC domain-containing protein [Pseudoteredinibacter isoporae]
MNAEPIIVEQTFDTTIDVLWEAITQQGSLQQWLFPEIESFRAEMGFETEFTVNVDGKGYVHQWKILDVIPGEKLVYQWRYKGFPGNSTVSWVLTENQGRTHLLFTHSGHETIQGDDIFSYENGLAGWRYLIQESLLNFLA